MSALLEVDKLSVRYHTPRGVLHAVQDISFELKAGETLGLVGESGCGKSSLGRAILSLTPAADGAIRIDGDDVTKLSGRALHPYRKRMQMVFQDPAGSLDPRRRVDYLIDMPLSVHGIGNKTSRKARVRELMQKVGLHADLHDRLPHELSGGQRQRVAIARALALSPSLLVCDEPVSALDVSLQAQILNLLADLQKETGIAYLFISHDLSVVQHLAHRVAVMYLGQIVEIADRSELWQRPAHPYTRALIDAVPRMDPGHSRIADRSFVDGDVPSPYNPPAGCRFHTRCPHAMPKCAQVAPVLQPISLTHRVACHLNDGAGLADHEGRPS